MIPELSVLTDIVAVKPEMPPCKSPGGIWIPITDNLMESDQDSGVRWGKIISAGPDCEVLKVGDRIMYHRSQCAPYDFSELGEEMPVVVQFLHEDQVLAVDA